MLTKYDMLVLPLWLIHYFGLILFVNVFGVNIILANIFVGGLIYAMSFLFQRDYVFKHKK